MSIYELCFSDPPENSFVEFSIGGVLPKNRVWKPTQEAKKVFEESKGKNTCYFGPAVRKKEGMEKEDVLASQVVWADIDEIDEVPNTFLPPTLILHSGHGYHLYWKLDKWLYDLDTLEKMNTVLAQTIGGDSVQNCNRLMRMPETFNIKHKPIQTQIVSYNAERVYDIEQIYFTCFVDDRIKRVTISGSTSTYKSRSERDWDIIREFVDRGLTDSTIYHIYSAHACGDKFRESGSRYLDLTINKARHKGDEEEELFERPKPQRDSDEFFVERDDGYYVRTKSGLRRISTFIINPKRLLSSRDNQDSLLVDVITEFENHKDHTLQKSAFDGTRNLASALPWADCVWLGRDPDTRALLAHLIYKIQATNIAKSEAVSVLGRHYYSGKKVFVARNGVLDVDGQFWHSKEAPLVYLDPGREAPQIEFSEQLPDKGFYEQLTELLPKINLSSVVWPIFGWFAATPLKMEYEELGYRFPVLNVFGTRGSGKSTTILKVFQPMFGYTEERSYDANTTKFVTLSLLASSNASPITFSEFRATTVTDFNRFVLLSYDTGHDPRGRADQTTQDYPLTAPFCVDGEDMLSDPATQERIVAVQLAPNTIREQGEPWKAMQELLTMDLRLFFRPYVEYTMKANLESILDTAEREIFDAFPMNIASRIRKNITLCWSGVLLVQHFFQSQGIDFHPESPRVLQDSLFYVYRRALGRSPMAADEFVEFVINQAASGTSAFPWKLESKKLWFQLTPAYQAWVRELSRERKDHLSRQAIRDQLYELREEYIGKRGTKTIDHKVLWCYPIDLNKAFESGLDVPESFEPNKLVVNF